MSVTVIVKKPNLKYKIPGYNKDKSFIAKVGQAIVLEKAVAKKELKTGNVRLPLEEEKRESKKKK